MSVHNAEIRKEIERRGLKYYEVAAACGVYYSTFSHWLQLELPDKKKREILKVIQEMKA